METIEEKVKKILAEYFEENGIQLESTPEGNISGFIVSEKFSEVEGVNRQKLIRSLLRKNLGAPEQKRVLGFFAMTPLEYQGYREANA